MEEKVKENIAAVGLGANEISGHVHEALELERRKKNIIVHGVEEPDLEDSAEKDMQTDCSSEMTIVLAVLKVASGEINNNQIEKGLRLGTREAGKTRPLLVELSTVTIKFKFMRGLSRLKDSSFKVITI